MGPPSCVVVAGHKVGDSKPVEECTRPVVAAGRLAHMGREGGLDKGHIEVALPPEMALLFGSSVWLHSCPGSPSLCFTPAVLSPIVTEYCLIHPFPYHIFLCSGPHSV